ncbi:MAG: hypothetical protein GWP91_15055 [Rhodobacterales bacterium]|nr:hypothetical protein [Rhodobacterales bacterium]
MYRPMKFLVITALCTGCIEYTPTSTLTPRVLHNPREFEPIHRVDELVQDLVTQVDVLWVVDNSSSMEEEQQGIAANFPVFLDFFVGSGLDYLIGVISTDMEDPDHRGQLQARQGHLWVDAGTPFPEQVLADMTTLGIDGSGDERGRDPIWLALTKHANGANAGFFRSSAELHVVVISDEEDSSVTIGEAEFLDWMSGLRVGEHRLTFSSIVSPDPICFGANDPGVEYIRYTERLGGIYWPICDQDWAEVLRLIGEQAAPLGKEYYLSALPDVDTIEVFVVDGQVTFAFDRDAWEYNRYRNSITFFDFTPDPRTTIRIEYDEAEGQN